MKIRHIHYPTSPKGPGVTVASELTYAQDQKYPSEVAFAISICSTKDCFSKKTGRELAANRLENKDPKFYRKVTLGCRRIPFSADVDNLIDRQIVLMDIPSEALAEMYDYIEHTY